MKFFNFGKKDKTVSEAIEIPVIGGGGSSMTGVTKETALALSCVWACVKLKADTLASLPIHIKDDDGNPIKEHYLYDLLKIKPNADMIPFEFWQKIVFDVEMFGNAYIHIQRLGNKIIGLYPLNPEKIEPKKEGISITYEDKENNVTYGEQDIWHIKGLSDGGLKGLSPLEVARNSFGTLRSANELASSEFDSKMRIGGFLTYPSWLKSEQREQLRKSMQKFKEREHANDFMVLEGGASVAGAGGFRFNPSDVQLLESRQFGIEELCRIYGVPPVLIGHTSKSSSWASSLYNTNQQFLTYGLRSIMVKIEQGIKAHLLVNKQDKDLNIKFKYEGLLRANPQERASYYVSMVSNGIMTRNEVRALEDLTPHEHADSLTVQLAMTTIESIQNNGGTNGSDGNENA